MMTAPPTGTLRLASAQACMNGLLCLACLVALQANAQNRAARSPYPSDAKVEAERAIVELERKPLFDGNNSATRNAPNLFPKVDIPKPSGIDIEALARRYEGRAEARGSADDLMVFASFSMPLESLKRLVASTGRAGGSVVLRGFKNNSYKETVRAIAALGEGSSHVTVNPNAFTKYKVTVVPMVVLSKTTAAEQLDADGCALPDSYFGVGGDVTLSYALEHIAARSPDFRVIANRYARTADASRTRP